MGILNVTPDSFSDGGCYEDGDDAVCRGLALQAEGADIIDIGGESSRPGAERVGAGEQIRRTADVIGVLSRELDAGVMISVDTTLASVAEAALDRGAGLVNDISAGRDDPGLLELIATRKVPIVLMHMQGQPGTMQRDPRYEDVVEEVTAFLLDRAESALRAGVDAHDIILDPGIGFGKRLEHNLALLASLPLLVAQGFPVLLGTSRKRFLGDITGAREPLDRVAATCATTALGVQAGVSVLRVHDVAQNRQALEVAWAIREGADRSAASAPLEGPAVERRSSG